MRKLAGFSHVVSLSTNMTACLKFLVTYVDMLL